MNLVIKDLYYGFSGKTIISGLSFECGAGEIIEISGANGAGKTSLLNLIAGLKTPDKGTIHWTGQHRFIYLGSSDRGFFPVLNGWDNLALLTGLRPRDLRARAARLEVDDMKFLERTSSTYSLGEKQLLRLLRAKLSDGDVLFIDEPLRSLDAGHAAAAMKWIETDTRLRWIATPIAIPWQSKPRSLRLPC